MERSESNQLEASPTLCRAGCGFFGSPNTDGFCSKCYKDQLKKKQQPPSSTQTAVPTPVVPTSTAQPTVPSISQPVNEDNNTSSNSCATSSSAEAAAVALPSDTSSQDADTEPTSSPDKDGAKKKKNKCQSCKKKVGLTGFTCRCGGLYCSVHRYSNEHECTFDYRNLGAEEIRRNNPVIKGEKIKKI